jgi:hypothetical protein
MLESFILFILDVIILVLEIENYGLKGIVFIIMSF